MRNDECGGNFSGEHVIGRAHFFTPVDSGQGTQGFAVRCYCEFRKFSKILRNLYAFFSLNASKNSTISFAWLTCLIVFGRKCKSDSGTFNFLWRIGENKLTIQVTLGELSWRGWYITLGASKLNGCALTLRFIGKV